MEFQNADAPQNIGFTPGVNVAWVKREKRHRQEVRKPPGGILSTLHSGFHRFSLVASKKINKKNINKAFPTPSRRVLRFHLLPLPFSEGIAHQIKRWSESSEESCTQLKLLRVPSSTLRTLCFIFSALLILVLPHMGFFPLDVAALLLLGCKAQLQNETVCLNAV